MTPRIPAGWYRLRVGTQSVAGDKMWSVHMNRWICMAGDSVVGEGELIIRKRKVSVREMACRQLTKTVPCIWTHERCMEITGGDGCDSMRTWVKGYRAGMRARG